MGKSVPMPNGHGGIPKYGSPFLLLLLLSGLVWIYSKFTRVWLLVLIYLVGILFSWRTCWHLHMYDVTEYDGAYSSAYEMEKARRRYKRAFFILTPLVLISIWCFIQNYFNHR